MNQGLAHNREFLLLGPKRNAVLELSEVQRYGTDSYGDPDYVTIYGLRPADWFAKGVRLLGHERLDPAGVCEITQRFDWSVLSIFDLGPSGERHGLLLGTIGWVPTIRSAAANDA